MSPPPQEVVIDVDSLAVRLRRVHHGVRSLREYAARRMRSWRTTTVELHTVLADVSLRVRRGQLSCTVMPCAVMPCARLSCSVMSFTGVSRTILPCTHVPCAVLPRASLIDNSNLEVGAGGS